jgi:kynurenine formamidase
MALDLVDLTQPLGPESPAWPGASPVCVSVEADDPEGYFARHLALPEHAGTHVDAPAHFIRGGATVDAIAPARLRAPAVVLDLRAEVTRDPDFAVRPADLEAWERGHGPIPDDALIVARTGWSERWAQPARYRHEDERGVMHFPGFGEAAIAWLLAHHPSFVGVGIDTLSLDPGASTTFAAHRRLLGGGKYGVENLTGLEQLPARGARIIVAPLKLTGGSGAPARVFAELER